MERLIHSFHRHRCVVALQDAALLFSVIHALPIAAAVVDERGAVVVMNGHYQQRRRMNGAEAFMAVHLGSSGHRLLLEKEARTRQAGFAAAVARYRFTRREAQVLELLMEGLASRTIAARLELGVRTVESHVAKLLQKSEAESRSELIARVFQEIFSGTG